MYINLKVSNELNEKRKALNLTWRDLIQAGLKASQKQEPLNVDHSSLIPNLRLISRAVKDLYDTLKSKP
jgi:hypothetical protein